MSRSIVSHPLRLAALAVPLLTLGLLFYRALADLGVTVTLPEVRLVAFWVLALGAGLGLVAAFGPAWLRTSVLALMAVVWVDMALPVVHLAETLVPTVRIELSRDRQRITDIKLIKRALDTHIRDFGPLPRPAAYGEGTGPQSFWGGWWDFSTHDGNGNGRPFLDFLVERGLLLSVPVDPLNVESASGHPSQGSMYVYFVVPPDYVYEGGVCEANAGASTYLLAATRLERPERLGADELGEGCSCLWRDAPEFFAQYFDFAVCGRF
jgi:hypothetical protein